MHVEGRKQLPYFCYSAYTALPQQFRDDIVFLCHKILYVFRIDMKNVSSKWLIDVVALSFCSFWQLFSAVTFPAAVMRQHQQPMSMEFVVPRIVRTPVWWRRRRAPPMRSSTSKTWRKIFGRRKNRRCSSSRARTGPRWTQGRSAPWSQPSETRVILFDFFYSVFISYAQFWIYFSGLSVILMLTSPVLELSNNATCQLYTEYSETEVFFRRVNKDQLFANSPLQEVHQKGLIENSPNKIEQYRYLKKIKKPCHKWS